MQVTLASDLLWHINGREATAAVGYDVTLRQARLQGKIDSTGTACLACWCCLHDAINDVSSAASSSTGCTRGQQAGSKGPEEDSGFEAPAAA